MSAEVGNVDHSNDIKYVSVGSIYHCFTFRLPEKCKKAQSIQNSLLELGLVGLTDLPTDAGDCTITDITNSTR